MGIGGVLEPLQAAPVIIEDGAFIGSISGFVGRYVLGLISSNVKEKKRQVNELHVALSNAKQALKDAVCDDRYSTFAQTSARHIPYITLNVPT